MKRLDELDKGQIAYRDNEGQLMILPANDQDVRDAFIKRLMVEHIQDKDLDQLLKDFKQAYEDVRNGDTKSIEELTGSD